MGISNPVYIQSLDLLLSCQGRTGDGGYTHLLTRLLTKRICCYPATITSFSISTLPSILVPEPLSTYLWCNHFLAFSTLCLGFNFLVSAGLVVTAHLLYDFQNFVAAPFYLVFYLIGVCLFKSSFSGILEGNKSNV